MLESQLEDEEEFYPYYSEEPVTESDAHRLAAAYLDQTLRAYFESRPDVYVSANMFVYYKKGDREEKKVSPDVFVCFGADKRLRKSFLTWKENAVPQVVFEITSDSSRLSDDGEKRAKYSEMGVQEYYLFDPWGEWIAKQFRAYRREGDELVRGVGLRSPLLGLEFEVDGSLLRLIDPRTGLPFPTPEEVRREAEEARREAEELRREAEELRGALEEQRRRTLTLENKLQQLDG